MKNILLSLAMISLVGSLAIGATRAYFTDTERVTNNTFSFGNVDIGGTWHLPINLNNLAPGVEVATDVLGVNYTGSINADLYVGMKAVSGENLKPILDFYIEEVSEAGESIRYVTGWQNIETLFGTWTKIYDNAPTGWKFYRVHVRVDAGAGDQYEGKTTTSELIIYATQHGGPTPNTLPYLY